MKYRILIIEDDTMIQTQLKSLLAGNGYEPEIINDFPVSMEQLKSFQPHLILLDIKLPESDGFSLRSQIRTFSNVPIILSQALVELEKINCYTEQALYYARSEYTEKDYSVREIRLFDAVHQSIAENKYLLLQNGVGIDLQETDDTVYSDEKWLCFILNQFIVNSVKYRTELPVLKFYMERQGSQVILCVQDNGIGINPDNLRRIFEKGFTGQNGRKTPHNSTGIGLYLCKRLCDKLGIGICADSKDGGTIFRLIFHINDFIQRVQG